MLIFFFNNENPQYFLNMYSYLNSFVETRTLKCSQEAPRRPKRFCLKEVYTLPIGNSWIQLCNQHCFRLIQLSAYFARSRQGEPTEAFCLGVSCLCFLVAFLFLCTFFYHFQQRYHLNFCYHTGQYYLNHMSSFDCFSVVSVLV